ncbi:MAG: SDR family oxidoreductase [Candidatus Eremiobacteraeota bacterium]|nr:SDR family oxidoreductase [Candidatus Eremiobacteraeota bacterium]
METITRDSAGTAPRRTLRGAFVITGAASGLGAAIADAIADAGGTPVVLDVRESGGGYDYRNVDVSDVAAVTRAVDEAAATYGGLSGVVANAGIDACGPFDKVGFDRWQRVINVNLIGTAALVRAALPYLEEHHGRIVTVASTLGLRALSDASAYCASKFGVVGFTRALSAELKGRVGITLLIPGGMRTSFFDGRDPQYQPGPDAQLNAPSDVANAVVFALSQPEGCDVRELLICPNQETSWP